jgi:hypothetical protein
METQTTREEAQEAFKMSIKPGASVTKTTIGSTPFGPLTQYSLLNQTVPRQTTPTTRQPTFSEQWVEGKVSEWETKYKPYYSALSSKSQFESAKSMARGMYQTEYLTAQRAPYMSQEEQFGRVAVNLATGFIITGGTSGLFSGTTMASRAAGVGMNYVYGASVGYEIGTKGPIETIKNPINIVIAGVMAASRGAPVVKDIAIAGLERSKLYKPNLPENIVMDKQTFSSVTRQKGETGYIAKAKLNEEFTMKGSNRRVVVKSIVEMPGKIPEAKTLTTLGGAPVELGSIANAKVLKSRMTVYETRRGKEKIFKEEDIKPRGEKQLIPKNMEAALTKPMGKPFTRAVKDYMYPKERFIHEKTPVRSYNPEMKIGNVMQTFGYRIGKGRIDAMAGVKKIEGVRKIVSSESKRGRFVGFSDAYPIAKDVTMMTGRGAGVVRTGKFGLGKMPYRIKSTGIDKYIEKKPPKARDIFSKPADIKHTPLGDTFKDEVKLTMKDYPHRMPKMDTGMKPQKMVQKDIPKISLGGPVTDIGRVRQILVEKPVEAKLGKFTSVVMPSAFDSLRPKGRGPDIWSGSGNRFGGFVGPKTRRDERTIIGPKVDTLHEQRRRWRDDLYPLGGTRVGLKDDTRLGKRPYEGIFPSSANLLKQEQGTIMKMKTSGRSITPRTPPNKFKFELPPPPTIRLPGFGGDLSGIGKMGRMKSIGIRNVYKPSLVASALNIRGNIPKNITGLEIRPIPRGRRGRNYVSFI